MTFTCLFLLERKQGGIRGSVDAGVEEGVGGRGVVARVGDLHGVAVGHVDGAVLGIGGAVGREPSEPEVIVVAVIIEFLIVAGVVVFPVAGAVHEKAEGFLGVLHTLPCAAQIPALGGVVVFAGSQGESCCNNADKQKDMQANLFHVVEFYAKLIVKRIKRGRRLRS